jgi:SAM-dependent methyltransferase
MAPGDGASGPDPQLIAWLRSFTATPMRRRCLVAGCGAGDDAEALASAGYEVTAFDPSPEAIAECRRRFPRSGVHYEVADVLAPPGEWAGRYDFVYDGRMLQDADPARRAGVRAALAGFLAAGGRLFVLSAARDAFDGFDALGLRTALIEELDDDRPGHRLRAFFDRLEV